MENGWKTAILVGFALDSNFASSSTPLATRGKDFEGISKNSQALLKKDLKFWFSASYQAKSNCSDGIKKIETFFFDPGKQSANKSKTYFPTF